MLNLKMKLAKSLFGSYNEFFKINKEDITPNDIKKSFLALEKKLEKQTNEKEYINCIINFNKDIASTSLFLNFKDLIEQFNSIKYIVIFDIDDTIRNTENRIYIREKIQELNNLRKGYKKDTIEHENVILDIDLLWKDFFSEGINDEPLIEMINLCNFYYDEGFEIKFRTGASELYRDDTLKYFKNYNVKFHDLKMRKQNVRIPDYNLKPSWIKYDLAENIFAIYDDREPVNENYRKKGVSAVFTIDPSFNIKEHSKNIVKRIEEIKKAYL